MSLITQKSRISHHTIVGYTGSYFTTPSSNDFTDGSWTIYDLAYSEFGINETDKKTYIRTGTEVKEVMLGSFFTASTIGTQSSTLVELTTPNIGVDWYKIQIKGQADASNYETIVSDIFFGLRGYGTSSIAFTGGTYSLNTYKDFSAVGIGPQLTISGLTLSVNVNGAAGYTISWTSNIQKG